MFVVLLVMAPSSQELGPPTNPGRFIFVKTLKRNYARNVILADAKTTLALLPGWFDDYNESHPHSGLRFLSPREFEGGLKFEVQHPAV